MALTRRAALRQLTILVGGAISAPAVGAVMSGLRAEPIPQGWVPRALTRAQADLLGVLVDHIIPPTDTPGARFAGVPAFIDKLLADWVEPADRARFLGGLVAIDEQARQSHNVGFGETTLAQQQAVLTRLDREAIEARDAGVTPLPFFAALKEWTIVGYYTSEVGATQELRWLATPGRYAPDLPLREVGRTWA